MLVVFSRGCQRIRRARRLWRCEGVRTCRRRPNAALAGRLLTPYPIGISATGLGLGLVQHLGRCRNARVVRCGPWSGAW